MLDAGFQKTKIGSVIILGVTIIVLAALGIRNQGGNQPPVHSRESQDLIRISGIEDQDSASLQFDKLRQLVNAHSRHPGECPLFPSLDYQNIGAIMASLYQFAAGERDQAPPANCAERAAVLAELLRARGFQARLVTLFGDTGESWQSHTLVDAYNPVTRRWEAHDPAHNVFFVFRGSVQRVGTEDFLRQPVASFEPCHMAGFCGWESLSPEGLETSQLRAFLGAALWHDKGTVTLLVNESRFDIDREYDFGQGEPASFCETLPAACAGKMVVID